MFSPPLKLLGVTAHPRGDPVPKMVASAPLALRGGNGHATFLRWDLADFQLDDANLNSHEGWILTIGLDLNGTRYHLSQSTGIFWTSDPAITVNHILASQVRGQMHRPTWQRRSERYWPHVASEPLPFLGQISTADWHVYLFGDPETQQLAAYVDPCDTQDIEDHYDSEA